METKELRAILKKHPGLSKILRAYKNAVEKEFKKLWKDHEASLQADPYFM